MLLAGAETLQTGISRTSCSICPPGRSWPWRPSQGEFLAWRPFSRVFITSGMRSPAPYSRFHHRFGADLEQVGCENQVQQARDNPTPSCDEALSHLELRGSLGLHASISYPEVWEEGCLWRACLRFANRSSRTRCSSHSCSLCSTERICTRSRRLGKG